jgi:hypothetical protein
MPVERGPATHGQLAIEREQQRLIGWMPLVVSHRIALRPLAAAEWSKDSNRVYARRWPRVTEKPILKNSVNKTRPPGMYT